MVTYSGCEVRKVTDAPSGAKEGLLEEVKRVSKGATTNRRSSLTATALSFGGQGLLWQLLRDLEWVDNLIVLPGLQEAREGDFSGSLKDWARCYRHLVNPDLVVACVALEGGGRRMVEEDKHPNDFFVSGFSETIFQCLSNCGGNGQVRGSIEHVNH